MREYDPALLGFVLFVQADKLPKVKDAIVQAVFEMESDERAYIYRPGSTHIARWPGEAVGQIANYKHSDHFPLRFSEPIDHTVSLMAEEDEDAKRHIFIIIDHTVPYMNYELKRGMKTDLQVDFAGEGTCNFYIIDLGAGADFTEAIESHPRCVYVSLKPEELGDFILKTYKVQKNFNIEYQPINLTDIQHSYDELKETDGEDCRGSDETCEDGDNSVFTFKSGHHYSVPRSVREGCETGGEHSASDEEQPVPDHAG